MLLALLSLSAHAAVFVSVPEAQALMQQGAVLVDARSEAAWLTGHAPGAGPLGWLGLRDGLLRTGRLTDDTDKLQTAIRRAGVRGGAPVVVYDAGKDGWGEAGRAWWTLSYLGHPSVHILDGGLPAWQAAGLSTVIGATLPLQGDFVVRPDASLRAGLPQVEQSVAACQQGPCDVVFWDTREPREYEGATPYGEARGGHLPGAVSLWFSELTDAQGQLLPQDQLQARLLAAGITPDKLVIPYCTGGVRSGFAVAVLTQLRYPRVANYDGSMWEWSSDPGRVLVK